MGNQTRAPQPHYMVGNLMLPSASACSTYDAPHAAAPAMYHMPYAAAGMTGTAESGIHTSTGVVASAEQHKEGYQAAQ